MSDTGAICGAAKGTKDKPFRCICCLRCYANPDALAVSICWMCMGGDYTCKACRERGIFVDDFRVGRWSDDLTQGYDPQGGLGHRLVRLSRTNGIMACGFRIPKLHFGGGSAVVPPCPVCWPEGLYA